MFRLLPFFRFPVPWRHCSRALLSLHSSLPLPYTGTRLSPGFRTWCLYPHFSGHSLWCSVSLSFLPSYFLLYHTHPLSLPLTAGQMLPFRGCWRNFPPSLSLVLSVRWSSEPPYLLSYSPASIAVLQSDYNSRSGYSFRWPRCRSSDPRLPYSSIQVPDNSFPFHPGSPATLSLRRPAPHCFLMLISDLLLPDTGPMRHFWSYSSRCSGSWIHTSCSLNCSSLQGPHWLQRHCCSRWCSVHIRCSSYFLYSMFRLLPFFHYSVP